MKVFLSHRMHGLSDEEVMKIRNKALNNLRRKYRGVTIELIDNYHHEDVPDNAGRLWHLGTSIRMMEEAELVYFCSNWRRSYGCQIEYEICQLYDLNVDFEED